MNRKYDIIEQIGTGCFGSIYRGRNIRTGELVAIKVETISSNTKMLKNESVVYQYLKGCDGVPKVKWYGKDELNYYMVIELLGQSIESLKADLGSLPLKLTLQIGCQILCILQSIHKMGLVHRDIKPDNFLLGLNAKSRQIYMIDFGFCKKYSNSFEPIKTSGLVGSPNYASINAHNLYDLSRCDDLESLGYMLVYLHMGRLSWQDCVDHPTIMTLKMLMLKDSQVPSVLVEYMRYVRSLKFTETPDYYFLSAFMRI